MSKSGLVDAPARITASRERNPDWSDAIAGTARAHAAALGGFGRIFFQNVALQGVVPQVSVISGTSAGGGCGRL